MESFELRIGEIEMLEHLLLNHISELKEQTEACRQAGRESMTDARADLYGDMVLRREVEIQTAKELLKRVRAI